MVYLLQAPVRRQGPVPQREGVRQQVSDPGAHGVRRSVDQSGDGQEHGPGRQRPEALRATGFVGNHRDRRADAVVRELRRNGHDGEPRARRGELGHIEAPSPTDRDDRIGSRPSRPRAEQTCDALVRARVVEVRGPRTLESGGELASEHRGDDERRLDVEVVEQACQALARILLAIGLVVQIDLRVFHP
jgi:hypothetical protein